MQNHRFYAVINSNNEKGIFASSREYMSYKHKNRNRVNCKGFEDMASARQYLAEHDYRCFAPLPRLDWEHDSPVFTEPLEQGVPAHANIYVYTRRDSDGCGIYSALISSPQYAEPYLLLRTIPADKVLKGTPNTFQAIVQALRFAYDNGFRSITVYTTNRCAAYWPVGDYEAKSKVAEDYLNAIDDLTENRHTKIKFVRMLLEKADLSADYRIAKNAVEDILQSEACIA
jgi:hypothetical protein